jgi:hypothetical protein
MWASGDGAALSATFPASASTATPLVTVDRPPVESASQIEGKVAVTEAVEVVSVVVTEEAPTIVL